MLSHFPALGQWHLPGNSGDILLLPPFGGGMPRIALDNARHPARDFVERVRGLAPRVVRNPGLTLTLRKGRSMGWAAGRRAALADPDFRRLILGQGPLPTVTIG